MKKGLDFSKKKINFNVIFFLGFWLVSYVIIYSIIEGIIIVIFVD